MKTQTAVVLGASGLTGSLLLPLLLNNPAFSIVRILVRKSLEIKHDKLQMVVTDFTNLPEYRKNLGSGDTIFCCIGTTQKKVKGDLAAYRKIDIDIPLHAAQMGKDAGFSSYLLVSAVGANVHAGNYYLKIKGEVEHEIAALQYERFHVFRPSLVLGDRQEFRLMELMAKSIMKLVQRFMVGRTKKYRGMMAINIAAAMAAAARNPAHGMFVHHYSDMMALAINDRV